MSSLSSGKAVYWLVSLLAVAIGAFALLKVPEMQKQGTVDSYQTRQLVGSSLRNAAQNIEDKTRVWPKGKADLLGDPALAAVDAAALAKADYELVRVDKEGRGVYVFTYEGKSTELPAFLPKRFQAKKPTVAAAGQ